MSSNCDVQRWQIDARTPRYHVELDGRGTSGGPHVLPVPLPGERRNIDTDYEYLAGTLHCRVREWGRTIFDGTSDWPVWRSAADLPDERSDEPIVQDRVRSNAMRQTR